MVDLLADQKAASRVVVSAGRKVESLAASSAALMVANWAGRKAVWSAVKLDSLLAGHLVVPTVET